MDADTSFELDTLKEKKEKKNRERKKEPCSTYNDANQIEILKYFGTQISIKSAEISCINII